jgi:hypothetical protein
MNNTTTIGTTAHFTDEGTGTTTVGLSVVNKEEYKICQKRGHSASSGVSFGYGPTHYTCEYCGVRYHTETNVIEDNPPE